MVQIKEKIKEECSVSGGDKYKRDDEAQLIGQIQEKLEMSREEIKRILRKL